MTESALAAPGKFTSRVTGIFRGVGTVECGSSLGKNAFKAVEDFVDKDKLCTGLCLLSCSCELVGIVVTRIPFPGSGNVYVCTKALSYGCMGFRDKCRAARGKKDIPGC